MFFPQCSFNADWKFQFDIYHLWLNQLPNFEIRLYHFIAFFRLYMPTYVDIVNCYSAFVRHKRFYCNSKSTSFDKIYWNFWKFSPLFFTFSPNLNVAISTWKSVPSDTNSHSLKLKSRERNLLLKNIGIYSK